MSIFTALSGAVASEEQLDTIANNLANVNTRGFKKDQLTFKEYLTELEKEDESGVLPRARYTWEDYNRLNGFDKSFVDVDTKETDFTQGAIEQTGEPLDIAINGEGFFAVKTPSGVAFTRNGSFSINKEGELVTSEGHVLLTGDGPIETADAGKSIKINASRVDIDGEGNIYQDGQKTHKISLVSFEDLRGLSKKGNSLYVNSDTVANPQKTVTSELVQGAVEGSNVNPIAEMVHMIAVNRAFQAYQNIIKSFNEINSKSVNEVGRLIG